jgi:hypothetical protein
MATAAAIRQVGAYYGRSLPRRAVLTVPSSDWKKLTKLPTFTNTDCVVLDLEDGVAETAKSLGRQNIFRYLNESVSTINREICLRINAVSSNHINDDIKLLKDLSTSIDCLFVPKVDSVDEMKWLADHLGVSVKFLFYTILYLDIFAFYLKIFYLFSRIVDIISFYTVKVHEV